MRRFLVLPGALLSAMLVLSGCQADGAPYAAQVASRTITRDSLNATLGEIASNSVARCLFTSGSVKGAGTGNYNSGFVSSVLTFMIESDVVANENARLGLTSTSLAGQAATQLLSSLSGNCTPSTTAALPPGLHDVLTRFETSQALYAAHLAGTSLTPSALASFATAHPNAVGIVCASDIVVSSSATADSIVAKLKAGTSFASLARSSSLDTSTSANGGALGCGPLSNFEEPFSSAIVGLAAGEVSVPFVVENSSQGTYYAIVAVTSRKAGTSLDAALGAVTSGYAQLAAAISHLETSGVSVDPTYGNWGLVDGTYSVIAPSGPSSKFISNLPALTPPTTSTTPG